MATTFYDPKRDKTFTVTNDCSYEFCTDIMCDECPILGITESMKMGCSEYVNKYPEKAADAFGYQIVSVPQKVAEESEKVKENGGNENMAKLHVEIPETNFVAGRYLVNTGSNGKIERCPSGLGKTYTYELLPKMAKPNIGDLAVVSSAQGFGVIQITAINKICNIKNCARVVGFIDPAMYNEFLEKKEQQEALKLQIEEMKEKLQDLVTWELLAEKSPEFKALVDAYKATLD